MYVKDAEIGWTLSQMGGFLEKRVQDLTAQVLQAFKLYEDAKSECEALKRTVAEKEDTIQKMFRALDYTELQREYNALAARVRELEATAPSPPKRTVLELIIGDSSSSEDEDGDEDIVQVVPVAVPAATIKEEVPEPVVVTVPEPVVATVSEPVVATVPEPVVVTVPEPVVATVPEPVATVPEPVATVPEPVATVPEPELEPEVGPEPVASEEQEEPVDDEDEVLEVTEKVIGGKVYYVSTNEDMTIYEYTEDGDVGAALGRIEKINGKSKAKWF
jgi:hypothetical protein